jgi:hypothetical protein
LFIAKSNTNKTNLEIAAPFLKESFQKVLFLYQKNKVY